MNIATAKKIRLVDFMASLGYQPAKRIGNKYFYLSPFRQERTPSFNINDEKNLWFDFGEAKGGSIIELCKMLCHETTVSGVLRRLSMGKLDIDISIKATVSHVKQYSPMENLRFTPLENPVLLRYMVSRGISARIAKAYCEEIHYNRGTRSFFSVAFKSLSGGYEIRNAKYKGCVGKKDISYILNMPDKRQRHLCIFEGFMDFLSYKMIEAIEGNNLCVQTPSDYIILNSVANRKRGVEVSRGYFYIHCYLDNDPAGLDTVAYFKENCDGIVCDESGRYQDFKDVNDYLTKHINR